jgi:glycerol-3-phosphate dehydrogenase
MVPSLAGDGALVFAIPWGPRVYAGTTDTPYDGPLEDPGVEPADVEVVTASLARAFDGGLGLGDVRASWAGVRPLLDTGPRSTRDLSRRHVIAEDPPGLVTVTGGKLTTYRLMARQVVDRVCRLIGRGRPCVTHDLPLGLTRPLLSELGRAATAAERLGLPPDAGRRLVGRYGDDWEEVLGLVRDDPSLGQAAVPGLPVLGVELHVAREREMAVTEEDVLVRRTRLSTMDEEAQSRLSAAPGRPGAAAGQPAR